MQVDKDRIIALYCQPRFPQQVMSGIKNGSAQAREIMVHRDSSKVMSVRKDA